MTAGTVSVVEFDGSNASEAGTTVYGMGIQDADHMLSWRLGTRVFVMKIEQP